MAIQTDIIQPLKDTLTKAESIFVLLPQNAGQESVAAGLGLYQTLKQTGKNVIIASPGKLSQASQSLPGANEIMSKIGNRNLVISLKLKNRDSIDKVSYNLDEDGQTFNLVIQPKKGHQPLRQEDSSFSYSGAQADLIFMIGANRLEDLGNFYESERQLFTESKTVSINRFNSTTFADFHVSENQVSGNAELTYQLISSLNFELSADAATNFLNGIDQATNSLQHPDLKADTMESVAKLMRAGGTRATVGQPQITKPSPQTITGSQPVTPPPPAPSQNGQPATVPPQQPKAKSAAKTDVPKDWLAPKIYKGSGDTK